MSERGKRTERSWTVLYQFDETGVPVNRGEVQQSLLDAESIGHRLGGVVNAAPIREKAGEEYVTTGWLFEWAQYAPAVQASAPTPPTEGEAEREATLLQDVEEGDGADLPTEEPAVALDEFGRRLDRAQAEAAASS